MEEKDKLRILDLMSDELNEEEIQETQALIDSNPEAKAFYENSKITLNLLDAEMNSAASKASEKRLETLIHDLNKDKSFSFPFLSSGNFSIKSLGGILSVNNGLVAAFTFAFVLLISPGLINQQISLNESITYQEEIFISLTRSGENSETPLEMKKIYIQNLIDSGNVSGLFTSEAEIVFKISIKEAFKRGDKEYYFGAIEGNGEEPQNFSVTRADKEVISFSF
ncbi:hypothetical protein N9442_02815 [Gammaproteobacteria bacterium]|nr:hypothetical protein [Gammaproteobacteria bacterium]